MSSVVAREREKYEAMWSLPSYAKHSPGMQMLPIFHSMIDAAQMSNGPGAFPRATVLDAGCGSGKGGVALGNAGYRVVLCDLTPDGLTPEARSFEFVQTPLWADLHAATDYYFDFVYCCDVLEHIPTAFTMLVIQRLLDVAKFGVFLSISTVPDQFGAWIGEPLHQTVQSFTWWRDQLNALGRVVEARDLLTAGVYLVAPR